MKAVQCKDTHTKKKLRATLSFMAELQRPSQQQQLKMASEREAGQDETGFLA